MDGVPHLAGADVEEAGGFGLDPAAFFQGPEHALAVDDVAVFGGGGFRWGRCARGVWAGFGR